MASIYLWVKALHVIGVIAWMAAIMYLPRLFINHHQTDIGTEADTMLGGMERRLAKGIMTPAMVATWIFGIVLVSIQPDWFSMGWIWVKIAFVLGLSGVHGYYLKQMRAFSAGERPQTEKFWRIINEVPFILLIGIVIMVIVKPF